MNRREFIQHLSALALGAFASSSGLTSAAEPTRPLPRRPYGETGRELSVVGLGGIAIMHIEQTEANKIVSWAIDRGVNYFDVAPTYGNAQERLGPALKPYRDRCFLACKTTKRDAAGALAELEESLRTLQTDHFDLYQLHGLTKVEEVEQVFGPGGAMETFIQARLDGKLRYLGFSAHDMDAAKLALTKYKFDSVLFPLNCVCIENANFGPAVVEAAQQHGAARLALKALAWTTRSQGAERKYPNCWYQPIDDPELADLALRYTLDLPITAAVPPGDPRLFRLAVELASRYEPLTPAERQALMTRLQGVEPIFPH